MACNPSTGMHANEVDGDHLTRLSLRALALRDLRGTGRGFHDSVDSDIEQVLSEYNESEIIALFCDQLEEVYFSRFEREASPVQKLEVLDRIIGYCPSEDNAARARHMVEEAADAAIAEEEPGRAVTLLQWLLFQRAMAPEHSIPETRLEIHRQLRPTVLANRRTRFNRKFSASWREHGWLSEDGDQVTVQVMIETNCVGEESYDACEEQLYETARVRLVELLHELGMSAFELPDEIMGETQLPEYEILQVESNSSDSEERVFQGRVSLDLLLQEIYDWRGQLEIMGSNL